MLKQSIKLCAISSINVIKRANHKWDLFGAVCVERHPRITKAKTDIEDAYQTLLNQIELENSMKSDHELREEAESKQAELMKKGVLEVDADQIAVQNAHDIEDAGDEELAAFKFAPRVTEADHQNITTSLERRLDKSLTLLVQQKIGKDSFWLPPQGLRQDGETMRETAERVLRNNCGENLNVQIYGNAPIGFYKYIYPKLVREKGSRGAKVFYYLGKYVDGTIAEKVKYQWLDRQELKKELPEPVYKSVSQFLIPEESSNEITK